MFYITKEFSATNKMNITTQPEPIFANQQNGKKHYTCVEVSLSISPAGLSISPKLVYEGTLEFPNENNFLAKKKGAKKRELFEIIHLGEFDNKGNAKMLFRINEVSQKHRGKKFCVCLSLMKGDERVDVVCTNPIKVISKLPKKSRSKRKRSSEIGLPRKKTGRVGGLVGGDKAAVLLQEAYKILLAQSQRCPNVEIKNWLNDFLSTAGDDGGDIPSHVRKSPNSVMCHTSRTKVRTKVDITESPIEQVLQEGDESFQNFLSDLGLCVGGDEDVDPPLPSLVNLVNEVGVPPESPSEQVLEEGDDPSVQDFMLGFEGDDWFGGNGDVDLPSALTAPTEVWRAWQDS